MNLIEIVKKLVEFQTVTGSIEIINKCYSFITEYLSKYKNIHIKEITYDNVKSILFSNAETLNFDVLEVGHIDVVPVNNKDMFIPKIENNIMKGRGTADMKGHIACSIKTLEYVLTNNLNIKYGILIVSDEEVGGVSAENWYNKLKLKTKILLDCDNGENLNKIIYKSKGACFIKLKSIGKSAHGSTPWDGNDAIENLITTITNIRKLYPYYSYENQPSDKWVTTFHIGKISGGTATNAIAQYAEADLDFRYIQNYSNESIMADVKKCCVKGVSASYEQLGMLVFNNKDNKYIQLYKNIIEKETEKPVSLDFSCGATDARYWSNDKNTTIIANQATGGDYHSDNEWLDINSLEKHLKIKIQFLNELVNILQNN